PVLPAIAKSDRDPTVFWYEPGRHFVMVRHEEPFDNGSGKTGFAFFTSPNLLDWTFQSRIGDFNECPDLFELPVEGGRSGEKKWVLVDASFSYRVGSFDGQRFDPETQKLRADFGASKYAYAPQSWKPVPGSGTFPIQMGFLTFPKGNPAESTWHGQMSFPCELHLKQIADGLRLCREPIKAIESLYGESNSWRNLSIKPGQNPLEGVTDDAFDLQADLNLRDARAVEFGIRGETVRYTMTEKKLEIAGIKAPLHLSGERLRIRILVDRSSIEVFADEGQVSASRVVFFEPAKHGFSVAAEGGEAQIISLVVNSVNSVWK
ncbi:MAG: glycoside hydrolase family 32 protein, partial [Chthoniobacteraceae bacterium]